MWRICCFFYLSYLFCISLLADLLSKTFYEKCWIEQPKKNKMMDSCALVQIWLGNTLVKAHQQLFYQMPYLTKRQWVNGILIRYINLRAMQLCRVNKLLKAKVRTLAADASFDLLNPHGTEGIFKKREMRLRHPARNLVSKHVFLIFNA